MVTKSLTRLEPIEHTCTYTDYILWIRYYRSLTWFEFSFLEKENKLSKANPISSTWSIKHEAGDIMVASKLASLAMSRLRSGQGPPLAGERG